MVTSRPQMAGQTRATILRVVIILDEGLENVATFDDSIPMPDAM
jgi:hypothetical protein